MTFLKNKHFVEGNLATLECSYGVLPRHGRIDVTFRALSNIFLSEYRLSGPLMSYREYPLSASLILRLFMFYRVKRWRWKREVPDNYSVLRHRQTAGSERYRVEGWGGGRVQFILHCSSNCSEWVSNQSSFCRGESGILRRKSLIERNRTDTMREQRGNLKFDSVVEHQNDYETKKSRCVSKLMEYGRLKQTHCWMSFFLEGMRDAILLLLWWGWPYFSPLKRLPLSKTFLSIIYALFVSDFKYGSYFV